MTLKYTIENPFRSSAIDADNFGQVLVTDGQYLVVGAYKEDFVGTDSGRVDVYNATTGDYLYLINDPNAYGSGNQDYFGLSIAIVGSYIAVGAYNEDDATGSDAGVVYIFNIADGSLANTIYNPNWINTSAGDQFGRSISSQGGRFLFIGAPGEDDGVTVFSGGVNHVYDAESNSISWTFDTPSGYTDGGFGQKVAAYGNIGVTACPSAQVASANGSGRVLVYDMQFTYLMFELTNPDPINNRGFGAGLAISDRYIAVGANLNSGAGAGSGCVNVYDTASGTWLYKIDNPNAYGSQLTDQFGLEIKIYEDYLITGSIVESDAGGSSSGVVYIFAASTGKLIQTIKNPNLELSSNLDYFGRSFDIYGNTLYIGSPGSGLSSGKVYAYTIGGEGFGLRNGTDSIDLSNRYVTKGDLIDKYSNLLQSQKLPTVWIAGANANGILGLGDAITRSSPVQLPNPGAGVQWKQMVSSDSIMTGGLRSDGTIWMSGYNQNGQLGNGSTSPQYVSSPVQTLGSTWKFLDYQNWSSGGIQTDGSLYTWGYNDTGQLGQGFTGGQNAIPSQVTGGGSWATVSMGYYHVAAIKTNGTLWIWGDNTNGQLGNNSVVSTNSPIQVGGETEGDWAIVSASGGSSINNYLGYGPNTFAIKKDGTMWAWGYNELGQLGTGNTLHVSSPTQVLGGANWKQVSNNDRMVIALKTDGSLWSWGYGQNGTGGLNEPDRYRSTPTQIGRSNDWKFLASVRYVAGGRFAIKTDGTLWAWGYFPYLTAFYYSPFVSSPVQFGTRNDWKLAGAPIFGLVGITDDSLDGF